MKRSALLPLLAAVAAASAPARAASAEPAAEPYGRHLVTNALVVDLADAPVKDQRQSSTAPDLGYAGALTEGYGDCAWFYDPAHADATWKLFREAGAHVLKQWDSVMTWQKGLHESKAGNPNPKWCFDFWKKHGVKVLLTLEHHKVFEDAACTKKTDDLETVKRTILDYVRWIVDNGYQDVVGGFELGNEPYWGSDPEGYAARWVAIVPEIKRIFPEAKIGMPLAEYRAGDPDIAAVRARATGLDWVQGGGEFSFSKLNQWSGRFIVAMKPVLDDITHVIYHFYGADRAYGCSQSGYNRIHNFAKVFPEIADKRVWITEWRERADEDLRCHQRFFSTLWKGHYMLGVLMQPEIDGISLHNLATLSGGLYVTTDKGTWCVQRGANDREYPYVGASKDPVMEVGPAGPVFRLFTEALHFHPLVVEHVVARRNRPRQGNARAVARHLGRHALLRIRPARAEGGRRRDAAGPVAGDRLPVGVRRRPEREPRLRGASPGQLASLRGRDSGDARERDVVRGRGGDPLGVRREGAPLRMPGSGHAAPLDRIGHEGERRGEDVVHRPAPAVQHPDGRRGSEELTTNS